MKGVFDIALLVFKYVGGFVLGMTMLMLAVCLTVLVLGLLAQLFTYRKRKRDEAVSKANIQAAIERVGKPRPAPVVHLHDKQL